MTDEEVKKIKVFLKNTRMDHITKDADIKLRRFCKSLLADREEMKKQLEFYKADSDYIRKDWDKQNLQLTEARKAIEFYSKMGGGDIPNMGNTARAYLEKYSKEGQ